MNPRLARRRPPGLLGALSLLALALLCTAGCQNTPRPLDDLDPAPAILRGPPPTYADAAERFNRRLLDIRKLFATGEASITYTGDDGVRRREQVDVRLQVIRGGAASAPTPPTPARLALSLSKVGQLGAWLGCDADRYWFINLTAEPRWAAVGTHARFNPARAAEIGLTVPPRELVALLGLALLDPAAPGGTQWSTNARLLGITADPGAGSPVRRIWCDPESFMPLQIELFAPPSGAGAGPRGPTLVSRLADAKLVQTPGMAIGPAWSTRIIIADQSATGPAVEIELRLENLEQARVSDRAFDLQALLSELAVARVIDLDAPRTPPATPSPR